MKRVLYSRLHTAISLALAIVFFVVSMSHASASTARERRFDFEYEATVKDIPTGAKKVSIWIPVPHDSPFQKITEMQIDSPYPYEIHTAEYGNKILHIGLNNPAQSTVTVTMRFNAIRFRLP